MPHMGNLEYPKMENGSLEIIRYAFERLPLIENPIHAKIAMDSLYDVSMGFITPEELKARPLAALRMFTPEKMTTEMGIEGRLRLYAKAEVHKYFSVDPLQFLNYPRSVIEMMVRICKEMGDIERKETGATNKNMELLMKQFSQFTASQNQANPQGQTPPGHGTTGR